MRNVLGLRNASVEREGKIEIYQNSRNMKDTLYNYRDNDPSYGVISPKQITNSATNTITSYDSSRQPVERKFIFSKPKTTKNKQVYYLE